MILSSSVFETQIYVQINQNTLQLISLNYKKINQEGEKRLRENFL